MHIEQCMNKYTTSTMAIKLFIYQLSKYSQSLLVQNNAVNSIAGFCLVSLNHEGDCKIRPVLPNKRAIQNGYTEKAA